MQFLDEAKIYLRSGDGGNGCVSFRREKYVEFGGPDGGNGGRGAHIIFETDKSLNTLIDFRYRQHFKAPKGHHGMGANRTGGQGKDLVIKVPVGTQIFMDDKKTLLADLVQPDQRITLLQGGNGGFGNAHFKSSVNQAPRHANPGQEGQEMWVWLRLKLIADVGLVGFPNAGKSTFLSRVSKAKPKIADYPFTTLHPQLGIVSVNDDSFVLADIPGLIEGAHEGKGLGTRFLGHIERCWALLHLIDGSQENVIERYLTIMAELEAYSQVLLQKPMLIALNKIDVLSESDIQEKADQLKTVSKSDIFPISAVTGRGIQELLQASWRLIREQKHKDDINRIARNVDDNEKE